MSRSYDLPSWSSHVRGLPYFTWKVGHDRVLSRLICQLLDDAVRADSFENFSRSPLQYEAKSRLKELLDPRLGLIKPRIDSIGVIIDRPFGEARRFDIVLSFQAEGHRPTGSTYKLDRMSIKL